MPPQNMQFGGMRDTLPSSSSLVGKCDYAMGAGMGRGGAVRAGVGFAGEDGATHGT